MKLSACCLSFYFLGVGLLPTVASATSFQAMPFEETVKDAPVIARGKVTMQYAEWAVVSSGAKRIYTYIELQPVTFLKAPGTWGGKTRLVVREIGGQKDGMGMQVPGSAKFNIGEEVVVFASDQVRPDGALDLRGLMLSKLKVKTNEAGEETLAGPAISMGEDARPGQIVHADEHGGEGAQARTKKVWTVSALRQLIAEQGGRAPPAAEVGEGHTAALQAGQPVAAPTGSLSPGSTGAEQVGEFRSNGPPQESESSRGVYLKFGAALLAGLGLVAYMFRKTG
jgi:hypothetical protein